MCRPRRSSSAIRDQVISGNSDSSRGNKGSRVRWASYSLLSINSLASSNATADASESCRPLYSIHFTISRKSNRSILPRRPGWITSFTSRTTCRRRSSSRSGALWIKVTNNSAESLSASPPWSSIASKSTEIADVEALGASHRHHFRSGRAQPTRSQSGDNQLDIRSSDVALQAYSWECRCKLVRFRHPPLEGLHSITVVSRNTCDVTA